MIRLMVNAYINMNPNFKLEGLSLEDCVASEAASLEEYRSQILLKDKEYARTLVIALTPLVLRVQLRVVMLEAQEKSKVIKKVEQDVD